MMKLTRRARLLLAVAMLVSALRSEWETVAEIRALLRFNNNL